MEGEGDCFEISKDDDSEEGKKNSRDKKRADRFRYLPLDR